MCLLNITVRRTNARDSHSLHIPGAEQVRRAEARQRPRAQLFHSDRRQILKPVLRLHEFLQLGRPTPQS
jgi:hypothetical protein